MTRQQFEARFIKAKVLIPLLIIVMGITFYITWTYIAPAVFNH